MKTKVVTSFSASLWNRYAKTCISTWVEHLKLDEGSVVEVWINGPFPEGLPKQTKSGTPFKYKLLDTQSEGWQYFYSTWSQHPRPETNQGQEFKFNFIPFSCKVFALAEAAWDAKQSGAFDTFLWLDSDIKLTQAVTSSYLASTLGNAHLAWLDRGEPWRHGETGFILSRTEGNTLDIFLNQANMWGSGQLFFMAEWHDAFTFSSLVASKTFTDQEQFVVNNLNIDMDSQSEQGLYPFKTSVLNTHFQHFKGGLKEGLSNGNSN